MFSTLLTSPRAPLSRIHSTVRIPRLESEGAAIVLTYEDRAGIRQNMAANSASRLNRRTGFRGSPIGPRGRGRARATVARRRRRQWLKNILVIAAPGAAGALGRDAGPFRVALACVAFCLLASGIYAINDVRDAPEDRLHPRKRFRPIAAGELSARFASALGLGLIVAGLVLCAL